MIRAARTEDVVPDKNAGTAPAILFGSRVDDERRAGNIDLLVRPEPQRDDDSHSENPVFWPSWNGRWASARFTSSSKSPATAVLSSSSPGATQSCCERPRERECAPSCGNRCPSKPTWYALRHIGAGVSAHPAARHSSVSRRFRDAGPIRPSTRSQIHQHRPELPWLGISACPEAALTRGSAQRGVVALGKHCNAVGGASGLALWESL